MRELKATTYIIIAVSIIGWITYMMIDYIAISTNIVEFGQYTTLTLVLAVELVLAGRFVYLLVKLSKLKSRFFR